MMSAEIAVDITKTILEKVVEPVAKKAIGFTKDQWEKIKVDYDIAFQRYLKKAYDRYSKMKTILYRNEPKELYRFFEPPTLTKGSHEDSITYSSTDIDVILDISHFLIIEGTGGIGKSTLMKHFFLNELTKKELIPIFLELKSLNSMEDDYEISDYIFEKLYHLRSDLKKEYLEYALQSGCFLFLLDGYDEIVTAKKNVFFRKFTDFCDRYSENYYILSSRPNSEFIEFQRFSVLRLCEFSKEQALSMIEKLEFDAEVKQKFYMALDETLYDTHRSFASNPLLLTIMLLTFDNYADVPSKMHLFYAQAFDTLYSRHDATKGGYKREFQCNLSLDSFKKVFAKFCFLTYYRGKYEFTYDELVAYFKKVQEHGLAFDIPSVIEDLEKNLCILCKDGLQYQFTHRSFQEYFTAVFLKELPDEKMGKFGLKLIEVDTQRIAYDSTIDMLFNMAQERVEQNILLPFLEKFEKNCNIDKFFFYAQNFGVCIHKLDTYRLSAYFSCNNIFEISKLLFLWRISYQYNSSYTFNSNANETTRLFDYLENKIDYHTEQRIPLLQVLGDPNFQKILKTTKFGKRIIILSTLKETLEQKKLDSNSELDALLMMP